MSDKIYLLDYEDQQEDFFSDFVLIGITCTFNTEKFVWLLHKYLNIAFHRQLEMDVFISKSEDEQQYFPVFTYQAPLKSTEHVLYKQKEKTDFLLPEIKNVDYLWGMRVGDANNEASYLIPIIKQIPEIQFIQVLDPKKLKNKLNIVL